jgi:hypothetical protein
MCAIDDPTVRTRKEAQRWCDKKQEDVDAGKADPRKAETCGELMETWLESLDNRSADNDRWRAEKYLVPRFKDMRSREITKGLIVTWLRELKATTPLSGASRKKLFTLLSRFCSWLSAADKIDANPCRAVPTLERPEESGKPERPWLSDEAKVRGILFALPAGYSLMFATGRTGGLRPSDPRSRRTRPRESIQ